MKKNAYLLLLLFFLCVLSNSIVAQTKPQVKKTLFITDVKMKWVPEIKAFVSKGKIGIGNIYSTQINKYVNGYIMLKSNIRKWN